MNRAAAIFNWWRRHSVGQQLISLVVWASVLLGAAAFLIGILRLAGDIATMWRDGTLIDVVSRQVERFQVVLWIMAAIIAVIVLWFVAVLVWAWITLPLTLRAGVASLEGLRREVARLRRAQLKPGHAADLDDELED